MQLLWTKAPKSFSSDERYYILHSLWEVWVWTWNTFNLHWSKLQLQAMVIHTLTLLTKRLWSQIQKTRTKVFYLDWHWQATEETSKVCAWSHPEGQYGGSWWKSCPTKCKACHIDSKWYNRRHKMRNYVMMDNMRILQIMTETLAVIVFVLSHEIVV